MFVIERFFFYTKGLVEEENIGKRTLLSRDWNFRSHLWQNKLYQHHCRNPTNCKLVLLFFMDLPLWTVLLVKARKGDADSFLFSPRSLLKQCKFSRYSQQKQHSQRPQQSCLKCHILRYITGRRKSRLNKLGNLSELTIGRQLLQPVGSAGRTKREEDTISIMATYTAQQKWICHMTSGRQD